MVQYTVNAALVYISYPTQLVIGNLRLIIIFAVATFFSRMGPQSHSSKSKLYVGLFITIGIFLFNYESLKNISENRSFFLGVGLLLTCLIGEGFLVDNQTYLKKTYSPSSNDLFTCTNKMALLFSLAMSVILGELRPIMNFLANYQNFGTDLLILCVFGTAGQCFLYEMIKRFEPHIYTLLTVFRKIMTVVISIILYGHHISMLQIFGLSIVFSGLIYEIKNQFKFKK